MIVMMNIKRISTNPKKIPKEIWVSKMKGLNISGLNAITPIKKKYGAIVKNKSGRIIFALNFIRTLSWWW